MIKIQEKLSDLQKVLAPAGMILDSSTIRRRLTKAGRLARKSLKKQMLTTVVKEK